MNFADLQAADLRAIIADDPVTFVFAGEEYTGTRSGMNRRHTLEIGGFDDMPELTIAVCLKYADGSPTFVNNPALGERIRVNGIDYRIDRTEIDAAGVSFQMDLRSDTK